ncbi:hypothetical protein V1514DRAFT_307828 [Lipomyces japonicus]|uniref:uncharacterized protein n=1 Tax=Lipomyces japonicus TaxID=56871 RepID=UPI0034CF69A6
MSANVEVASLAASKKKLREKIAEKLRHVEDISIRAQSALTTNTLLKLPEYRNAKKIGIYMHMVIPTSVPRKKGTNVEVRTDTMIKYAFVDGKQVFLPRIVPSAKLDPQLQELFKSTQNQLHSEEAAQFFPFLFLKMTYMPDFRSVQNLVVMNKASHTYKIREPPEDGVDAFDESGLDLIIVPGLGFNKHGHRVGRGKGFYDNYIRLHNTWSELSGRPKPLLVGIALKDQIVEPTDVIPREEHDQILDIVLSGRDVYRVKGGKAEVPAELLISETQKRELVRDPKDFDIEDILDEEAEKSVGSSTL